ncbi:MAG: YhfC family intramembrane metalloprotease [Anaerolineae bacterium]|nr:MAG: YhfC family intramembrane metalloprotease [Anaerolineae bacterium]
MDIAVRLLNGLLMIAMPIALGIYLVRRTGQSWRLFLAGGVLFVGSQVLHIPFNLVVLNPILEQLGFGEGVLGSGLLIGALLLGLSAGLFEELTRWLGLRFWLKGARSWNSALMYGAGWGGAEAILLGLAVLWFLVQALMFRQGTLQSLIPAEQLEIVEAQFAAYWETPLFLNLIGAVERAFALAVQVSLSVMVMRAVTRHKLLWLLAAITWHTLVNAVAVVAVTQVGAVATEAFIGVMAAISLVVIFWLKEEELPQDERPGAPLAEFKPAPVKVTEEKLEDSRYSS